MKQVILIAIFTLSFGNVFAKNKDNCLVAKALAQKFITLDSQGETTHASKKIDELVDYRGRDTVAWDSVVLTKESKIKSCTVSESSADILVEYSVFGTMSGEVTLDAINSLLTKRPRGEIEKLHLYKAADGWKIDSSTVYMPHIVVTTAKKMMKKQ